MSEKRNWSFVTGEQLEQYWDAAGRVIDFAKRDGLHPFAAAVAGVYFIRNALETMGGDVRWWLEFVRTGNLPGFELPRFRASQNPPKA